MGAAARDALRFWVERRDSTLEISRELDGERKFQSGILTGVSDAVPIRIPLGAARRLLLEADPTPDGKQHDHLDWADARFTR